MGGCWEVYEIDQRDLAQRHQCFFFSQFARMSRLCAVTPTKRRPLFRTLCPRPQTMTYLALRSGYGASCPCTQCPQVQRFASGLNFFFTISYWFLSVNGKSRFAEFFTVVQNLQHGRENKVRINYHGSSQIPCRKAEIGGKSLSGPMVRIQSVYKLL